MKKWKRLVTGILCVSMVAAFSGCGGDDSASSASSGSDQESASASSGENTSESSGEAIKIGCYTYLTGSFSLLGECIQNGAQIAVDKINEEGGINGREVELIVYDDKQSTETDVQLVTRLIEMDGVDAIIAPATSASIVATAAISEEAQIIQTTGGVSTALTNAGYKYIFRSTGNGNLINTGLIDAMETMGTEKVGIVAVSSEYGENGVKNMTALLEDTDIELAPVEYFTTGDTDFTAQFTNLMNEGVDSIILYSNTTEQAQSMPQLERLGFEGLVFGTEGCSSSDLRNVAGESANGLIFVASYVIPDEIDDAINDVEKDFLETYVEKYGALPVSDTAYRAYDGANLIFEAMKNCENIDDKESIRDAFVQISGYEGIGGTFDYTDESGDGLSSARTYIIVDGKNVLLEDYLAEQG